MPPTCFQCHVQSPRGARTGELQTLHGAIQTPAFMPVGTCGSVKGVAPEQLEKIGVSVLLANTYHLHLRPGEAIVAAAGGLHDFMQWHKPILTDSGGYQIFSLAQNCKLSDAGAHFNSHINGDAIFIGARECFEIQRALNTDIAMVLDECPRWPCTSSAAEQAVRRSLSWARQFRQCAADWMQSGHLVFGIVQGSRFAHLRETCATELSAMEFSGYAVGGVSVGEPEAELLRQVACSLPKLPKNKPRYVMGVGTPPQLLKLVAMGADIFDCVLPTRLARHGVAFSAKGPLQIRKSRYQKDFKPLDEDPKSPAARFSRAYLHHLFRAKELLCHSLLSLHNLHFYIQLMGQARTHIQAGTFEAWAADWSGRYDKSE